MEAVKMVGLRRLIRQRSSLRDSLAEKVHSPVPSQHLARLTPKRFFDLHQLGNKEAIEKERARLADEMTRGYFADMAEFKKHADGKTMKLPIRVSDRAVDSDKSSVPKASLVCLSFRASSQEMINSWSVPFTEAFRKSNDVHLYQVSFIDSWLLCRAPIKRLLLWTMKKPSHHESKDTLQQQIVYSFGDHYYFRKELRILNLLTGYIFLLDNFGRVRWQGFGSATQDELSSLLSCTSLLLDQK
ncbi:hypothetical protein AAZX31_13G201800 [Glycine max]|uniref:Mitochondrial ATPase complex subunit ATP10 n=1 Tax=Glycine soja TaxID=3848 RepID=A0A445I859_GLYSO|nr:uncharacterized protein LOC100793428 isoform X2 [Glycine max]XP_028187503.1 uncharacterized protein LOC114374102 isoform X2 [Glycine soja]RZB82243.1 hypothetical protein D0Y65_031431 [Glycine soja]|eukprot:XP_006594505.1 uncharacterized protein LOC100793428 isoform X2 [Glycine max]